jgi:hypothetical protein
LALVLVGPVVSGAARDRAPRQAIAESDQREITPVADTWIEVAALPGITPPATPHGLETTFRSGWIDSGIDERALIRFDVPTVQPDYQLERAELELRLVAAGAYPFGPPLIDQGIARLSLRRVTSAWDEATFHSGTSLETGEKVMMSEVAWGPCIEGWCGQALIDVRELLADEVGSAPWSRNGWIIDTGHAAPERATFGAYIVAASRESEHAPILRLQVRPVDFSTVTPTPVSDLADLRGNASYDCRRRGVVLRLWNDGIADAGPFAIESSSGTRWEIVGLDSRNDMTVFDAGPVPSSYRIDPDHSVPESDETNNQVAVPIPSCPTPTAEISRAWLPLVVFR